jgi:hypothetical protein
MQSGVRPPSVQTPAPPCFPLCFFRSSFRLFSACLSACAFPLVLPTPFRLSFRSGFRFLLRLALRFAAEPENSGNRRYQRCLQISQRNFHLAPAQRGVRIYTCRTSVMWKSATPCPAALFAPLSRTAPPMRRSYLGCVTEASATWRVLLRAPPTYSNADRPVTACPIISVWMSWVPS